jgi:Na+-transporting methylmalonyl-CoA/oxaloacetate decarboxylase gamma subunit
MIMFKGPRYTETELMARLKFTVGLSLAFTLTGIVFVVLYSLIFVTQPMTQSPNDAKFFELITPIATFLTGILSGIMLGKSEDKKEEPKKEEPEVLAPEPMKDVVDEVDDHIA